MKRHSRCRNSGLLLLVLFVSLTGAGCSIRRLAVGKIGDSFAQSSTTFASDPDLELVGDALPFALKLMEGLLAEVPDLVVDFVDAERLESRHGLAPFQGRSRISTQFGFLPIGYSFSLVSLPLVWSIE